MSTVNFLGKEYKRTSDSENFYSSHNSCVGFYFAVNIHVFLDEKSILILNVDLKDQNQEKQSVILQKILDENETLILKTLSEKIAKLSKVISLVENEFGKVLIFV